MKKASSMSSHRFDFLTPEFIKLHCKNVRPKIYPWRYLGYSDADFMATEIRLEGGPILPPDAKRIPPGRTQDRRAEFTGVI